MKFNECIQFLKELSRFDNVYLTIEGTDHTIEDYLLDDLTIADLRPFEDREFDLSYDGLHNGEEMEPRFMMREIYK